MRVYLWGQRKVSFVSVTCELEDKVLAFFGSKPTFPFFSGTILKRWKKNWFDLWSDGHLIYYDDQTRQSVEDKVHMPVDCINIRTGHECRDIQPPDGKPKDCMLQIVCRDGKIISLCAESTDDCL
ncbi:hypothetical protein GH733_008858 [Mirounga leonina]|nr:hypothetical protein GH733_008858 [Mirounga leonina]